MEKNRLQRYIAEVPANGSREPDSPDEVVIWDEDEGWLKLNSQEAGTTSDTSQLRTQLEQYFRERGDRNPSRTVFVKAFRKLPYTEVKKVMDAAKGAGGDHVGLQVVNLK